MSGTAKAILLIAAAAALMHPGPVRAAAAGGGAGEPGEILRLRIVNDSGGEISASRDAGRSWQILGRVIQYTTKVNRRGYTASKWVPPGRIAASAVNAIHVTVAYDREEDRGVVFSILPREFLAPPKDYDSFLSPDSSIYTDLAAGAGIFGGGEAPLVGSPVLLEGADGSLSPLPEGYLPARADALVVVIAEPPPHPIAAICENVEGGEVTLQCADGSRRLLGWVIRPARGIGRFAGSRYAAMGRIRANHAGVVDVSTSPVGFLGAFQIIPVGHALSPEMAAAWDLTQWMILGPVPEASPLWEGLAPLFYQHIRPDYRPGDLYDSDWREQLLSRFLVEADFGDGWRPLSAPRLAPDPTVPLPAWAHHALDGAERIRILFPLTGRGDWLDARERECEPR